MRTTIVTPQQRVLATLVKWTSLFLILLAVMAGTISGELPIGRTTLSRLEDQTCPPVSDPGGPAIIIGGQCIYTPSKPGTPCVAPYTPAGTGLCTAQPTNNGGSSPGNPPPSAAPPTVGVNGCLGGFNPVTINGATECQISNGTGTIDPSCSHGYVNVGGTCYSNLPVDLGDWSSGNCTLTPNGEEGEGSGEESGTQIYWCPYANGTQLKCVITGTDELCVMTGSSGPLGAFVCRGLNAGFPTSCTYEKNQATSTCVQGHCLILTCWDAGSKQFTSMIGAACPADPQHIQVRLHENCSAQVDGQKRQCDYDSTNGNSTKAVTLSISCIAAQTDPNDLSCSVTDPYTVIFNKQCVNTQDNQDNQALCTINTSLWVEQCRSTGNASNMPDCMVMTKDNLTLGTLHCDSTASCTIKDADGTNTMNITCPSYCHSDVSDCPHPAVPTTTAITEATIACDAKLVADMVMYGNGIGPKTFMINTCLSQTEIEFVLVGIGAGSQTGFPDKNLPTEVAL